MTKFVLSLDGGGVRGLASANFLRKLEFEMHRRSNMIILSYYLDNH